MSYGFFNNGTLRASGPPPNIIGPDFTYQTWVKLNKNGAASVVMTVGDAANTTATRCALSFIEAPPVDMAAEYTGFATAGFQFSSPDATWIHYAMVVTDDTIIAYFNGTPSTPATDPFNVWDQSEHRVGGNPVSSMSGQLAYIAWYSRGLSGADIALLAAGKNPQDFANIEYFLRLRQAADGLTDSIGGITHTEEGNTSGFDNFDNPVVDDPVALFVPAWAGSSNTLIQ